LGWLAAGGGAAGGMDRGAPLRTGRGAASGVPLGRLVVLGAARSVVQP
jgi:hypothetical protein